MLKLNYEQDLRNVKLFTVGTHTDSQGNKKTFTKEQLESAVEAFKNNVVSAVPVKMGHCSDEFVQKVADALDVPKVLLLGEGITGKGAVRLGAMQALKFEGDSLYGDFKLPDKVHGLVKDGFLNNLSVEMMFNRHHREGKSIYPCVMSGVAFLGAQRPALGKALPDLQDALKYEDGSTYSAYEQLLFSSDNGIDTSSTFESGETHVDPGIASDGSPGAQLFTVPFKVAEGATKGRQIFATVSAANEISARTVAWRVVENLGLNASGPAGTIVGTVGGIGLGLGLAKLLFMGRALRGGLRIGRIFWKSEEHPLDVAIFSEGEYREVLGRVIKYEVPMGVDPEAWTQ